MSRRTQWGVFVLQCLLDCKFANIKFGVRKDRNIIRRLPLRRWERGKVCTDSLIEGIFWPGSIIIE